MWWDILMLGAEGRSGEARYKIAVDLRLSLCSVSYHSSRCIYHGPLPDALRRFRSTLSARESAVLDSYKEDFLDLLLDDILLGIARPLRLIDLWIARPAITFDEVLTYYDWAGLKRSREWRERWVADSLFSMSSLGIPVPAHLFASLGGRGSAVFEYNERAYALAPERLTLTWRDFLRSIGPVFDTVCVDPSDTDGKVANEAYDYGPRVFPEILVAATTTGDIELRIDLKRMGLRLSREIALILNERDSANPRAGYRHIAWHNVFWDLTSDYSVFNLDLETRAPYLDADMSIVDYLRENCGEVEGMSRVTAGRRRRELLDAGKGLIVANALSLITNSPERFAALARDFREAEA